MSDWLLAQEAPLRLGVFCGLWLLLATMETVRPFRPEVARASRWIRHLLLVALGSLLTRFALPMLAVAAALLADERGQGLLNLLAVPAWLAIPLGIVLLDLAIYWQHRVFHLWPPLWRLHRTHHSDTSFELSTAVRFHPIEIWLSMSIKVAVVTLLGIPAIAVLLFEILLNASSLFTHSNFSLPAGLDQRLRRLLVTPDMHRIHHSIRPQESNSNYGFCLSVWDRLFRSYRERSEEDPKTMPIGLEQFRNPSEQNWWRLLGQPWR